jgi:hypothetical protein
MWSVLFFVWDLKRWIDGWLNLKGAVDATVKGPQSRSANLWIRIRTWICARCVCVWGSQIPLQRQDRERSNPGLSEESVAAVAFRCVALRSAPLCCCQRSPNLLLHQVRFVPHSCTLCMPQALGTGSCCYRAPELVITQKYL